MQAWKAASFLDSGHHHPAPGSQRPLGGPQRSGCPCPQRRLAGKDVFHCPFSPSKSLLPTAAHGFLEPLLRLMAPGRSHSKTENETRSGVLRTTAESLIGGSVWGHVDKRSCKWGLRPMARPSSGIGGSMLFTSLQSVLSARPDYLQNRRTLNSLTSLASFLSRSVVSNSLQPHVAHQAPVSMGFSRQEYCSGLPCLPPGDLPDPGIKSTSPAVAEGIFSTEASLMRQES